jgi:hypothetical protein
MDERFLRIRSFEVDHDWLETGIFDDGELRTATISTTSPGSPTPPNRLTRR